MQYENNYVLKSFKAHTLVINSTIFWVNIP